jgi:hypothetical protein
LIARVLCLVLAVVSAALLSSGPARADRDDEEPEYARLETGADLATRLVQGPVVVRAKVESLRIKAEVSVIEKLRGAEDLSAELEIAFRGANLERRLDDPPFEIVEDEEAIFVLRPWVDSNGEQPRPNLFRPAEDYRSRIPLPIEGREAVLEAVSEIVAFQDVDGHSEGSRRLLRWLGGDNPWLVDVAVDQAARFAYANRDWIPGLAETSRDARPWRRGRVAEAIGRALERGRFETGTGRGERALVDEGQREVHETLVRLARVDDNAEVRRTAVRWLGRVDLPNKTEILEAISQEDASQDVRYEAAAGLRRSR